MNDAQLKDLIAKIVDTPKGWTELINPRELSLDDAMSLMAAFKGMEGLGKKVGGYFREIVLARLPEGQNEYASSRYKVVRSERVREGGLDLDKITEEMGEEWVRNHRVPPTTYVEIRLTPVKTGEEGEA